MGIASMVIGIMAVIIGFVPFCGAWAIVPACVGLGLGIADTIVKSKRKQPKGMAIAGLVLNPIAIIVIISWWAYLAVGVQQAAGDMDVFQQQLQMMQPPQPGQIPTVPLPNQPSPQPMQPMQPVPTAPPTGQPQPVQPQPAQPGQPQPAQPVPVQPVPVQPVPVQPMPQ